MRKFAKSQFPPRAWEWASIEIQKSFWRGQGTIKGNMHIDYLMSHKKDYLIYLYENKLEMTMHDYYLGWDFLKDELDEDIEKIIKNYNLFNEKSVW